VQSRLADKRNELHSTTKRIKKMKTLKRKIKYVSLDKLTDAVLVDANGKNVLVKTVRKEKL
jgi:hypothetical protein